MLQGIPTSNINAAAFFEKRGYKAGWTSVNMEPELENFHYEKPDIPPLPSGITFRLSKNENLAALLLAVDDVQALWSRIFENCVDPVLLAVESKIDRIVGLIPTSGELV